MGLESCKVEAIIAVSDMTRARDFYEGKLGLAGGPEGDDGGVTYRCAGETLIHIYPSEHAGESAATLAAWSISSAALAKATWRYRGQRERIYSSVKRGLS